MEKRRVLNTTLALIMDGDKILLGEKKRGFAKGTFNGIGGKQDPGESIYEAMVRETQEEIGVTPLGGEIVGNINFINILYKGERVDINLSIFRCTDFEGEIKETEEMIPDWFSKDNMPYDKMLPDDVSWFPLVMEGKNIKGTIEYGETMQDKTFFEIKEVEHSALVEKERELTM